MNTRLVLISISLAVAGIAVLLFERVGIKNLNERGFSVEPGVSCEEKKGLSAGTEEPTCASQSKNIVLVRASAVGTDSLVDITVCESDQPQEWPAPGNSFVTETYSKLSEIKAVLHDLHRGIVDVRLSMHSLEQSLSLFLSSMRPVSGIGGVESARPAFICPQTIARSDKNVENDDVQTDNQ